MLSIKVLPYNEVGKYLKRDYFAYNILLDPNETNSYFSGLCERRKSSSCADNIAHTRDESSEK